MCRDKLVYRETISGVLQNICNFSSKQAKMLSIFLQIDEPQPQWRTPFFRHS